MDIFLLLPSCGWCVNHFILIFIHLFLSFSIFLVVITEVWILQGIYPLVDECVFGCSLKTRLADQTKTQQLKWLWSKDSMNSKINQRLVEQTLSWKVVEVLPWMTP